MRPQASVCCRAALQVAAAVDAATGAGGGSGYDSEDERQPGERPPREAHQRGPERPDSLAREPPGGVSTVGMKTTSMLTSRRETVRKWGPFYSFYSFYSQCPQLLHPIRESWYYGN